MLLVLCISPTLKINKKIKIKKKKEKNISNPATNIFNFFTLLPPACLPGIPPQPSGGLFNPVLLWLLHQSLLGARQKLSPSLNPPPAADCRPQPPFQRTNSVFFGSLERKRSNTYYCSFPPCFPPAPAGSQVPAGTADTRSFCPCTLDFALNSSVKGQALLFELLKFLSMSVSHCILQSSFTSC